MPHRRPRPKGVPMDTRRDLPAPSHGSSARGPQRALPGRLNRVEAVARHLEATANRSSPVLGWLVFGFPATWDLIFWSLVVHARFRVGEWPHGSSGHPLATNFVNTSIDPKVFDFHHDVVMLAAPFAVGTIAIGSVLLVASIFWRRIRPPISMTLTF